MVRPLGETIPVELGIIKREEGMSIVANQMAERQVVVRRKDGLQTRDTKEVVRDGFILHFADSRDRRFGQRVLAKAFLMGHRIVEKIQRVQLISHERRETHRLLTGEYRRATDDAFGLVQYKDSHHFLQYQQSAKM